MIERENARTWKIILEIEICKVVLANTKLAKIITFNLKKEEKISQNIMIFLDSISTVTLKGERHTAHSMLN